MFRKKKKIITNFTIDGIIKIVLDQTEELIKNKKVNKNAKRRNKEKI